MAAPTYFLVRHYPGPKWRYGTPFREQPGIELHIAHLDKLMRESHLLMAGPFLDGGGGAAVIIADDMASARVLAGQDPAVVEELLRVEVHPWLMAMDRRRPYSPGDPIYRPPAAPKALSPGAYEDIEDPFEME